MPVLSTLTLARPAVLATMDDLGPRVYTAKELAHLLNERREGWRLAHRISGRVFTDFLQEKGKLRRIELRSPAGEREVRYSWEVPSPYALAQSLGPRAYLSHSSAVYLHGLTDQLPKSFYINEEQTPKPRPKGAPTQERIDWAFKRPQRLSQRVFTWEEYRFVFLSGKQTGNYGTVSMKGPTGEELKVTDLERTLIDITVRPAYAGGVHEVAQAFTTAAERVSFQKLSAALRNLDYVYPYHQAIGFYLERAGVAPAKLQPLREMGLNFDFYLAHGMHKPVLDRSWRIFHPEGL